ncbi:hypothetical protein [Macrococcoides caseolyticum]|uniref:hypothetical protein n=1 Tax=Macrococcoides caseolyticum TaxID=69966 RepID=UPI000C32B77F|nr:hypothetical protein [Macrococcus caseolyticus]PKE17387.1 hypothetical protein CW718_04495 [Macrococcus caseolyticus]PKE68326.1 hypothetical protein CW663_03210 [Macrococcus caseolyticus]
MKNLNDVIVDVDSLKLKMDALNHLAFSNLETIESRLEQEWITKDITLKAVTEEQVQDLYILSTIISDVWKSVERLQDEIKKADTSRNTLASDEVPASNE